MGGAYVYIPTPPTGVEPGGGVGVAYPHRGNRDYSHEPAGRGERDRVALAA